MREEKLRSLWSESRELSLGPGPSIPQLPSAPSPLEFLRDFVSPNKPCVISSPFSSPPPALSLWSSDSYLRDALKSSEISLYVTPDGHADSLAPHPLLPSPSLCFASPFHLSAPISTALDLISSSNSNSNARVYYAQHQNNSLFSQFSPIASDLPSDVPFATPAFSSSSPPDAVNLWIGGPRSVTSFHKDHYENLYYVVTGEKHFLLLPPTELHRLYVNEYPAAVYDEDMRLEMESPERVVPWCSVDPCAEETEEERRRFPRYFDGPEVYRCTVRAGEMLYLPSMWFHHVRQSPDQNGRTIAVNYWYDMKFDIKYAYFNFLQSFNDDDNNSDEEEQVEQLLKHSHF